MQSWKTTGRLAASIALVAAGLVAGIALTSVQAASGNEAQEAAAAALRDPSAALPDMVPQGTFVQVADALGPAVVFIEAERPQEAGIQSRFDQFFDDFFGDDRDRDEPDPRDDEGFGPRARSQGSGVLVSDDGFIITNAHVVASFNARNAQTDLATDVRVTLQDDRSYAATIIGADIGTDIAVLKVDARRLPYAALGDSDQVRVGEWVMAIGAPFGLQNTVSAGIVSALGRADLGGMNTAYQDYVQTDAAINPGNSGGPLVNLRGEVVGINTAIASNGGMNPSFNGVGFAVPANLARRVMNQLIEHGRVIRGYLGVTVQPLGRELREAFDIGNRTRGAIINTVNAGGPAEAGGVLEGDIVFGTDGIPLQSRAEFLQRVALRMPGDTIALDILRPDDGGQLVEVSVPVTLSERPDEAAILAERFGLNGNDGSGRSRPDADPDPDSADAERLGFRVTELDERNARQLELPDGIDGVVVVGVAPNSPAARVGLDRGDVIRRIGGRTVTSVAEFEDAMGQFGPGDAVPLFLYDRSAGSSIFVAVRVPQN